MSYYRLMYHIVFRTKGSMPTLTIEHEKLLYAYMWGFFKNKKSLLYRIGGMPEHVHILLDLHVTIALADIIRELKVASNKWLKDHKAEFPFFVGWALGYAAFSYNLSEKKVICDYIANQKQHHRRQGFADEYRQFIESNGHIVKEQFFLKD